MPNQHGGRRPNSGRKKRLDGLGFRITIRLDHKSTDNLLMFCQRNHCAPSEAIRLILHQQSRPQPTTRSRPTF